MWIVFCALSVGSFAFLVATAVGIHRTRFAETHRLKVFHALLLGVVTASLFLFFPVHYFSYPHGLWGVVRAILVSVFNSMQIFGMGCEFSVISEGLSTCPIFLRLPFQVWAGAVFVMAPAFTFSVVLSLFKNLSASFRYRLSFWRNVCVFSELNERSLALATDIKRNKPRTCIVFAGGFHREDEASSEMQEQVRHLRAICFRHDILSVRWDRHSARKDLYLFAISDNEVDNLNHSLKLLETLKDRQNTRLFVFSTRVESELLLSSADRGVVKVRRICEVQSLINRILYERGEMIFRSARESDHGTKHISAVIVGLGLHGTEMLKALTWFGQMDGYRLSIHAFDRDPLAEEKLTVKVPELLSPEYNGRIVEGEAQYSISVHSGLDVSTRAFADSIGQITDATYVFVCLGSDELNVSTSVMLRMYFERMGIRPIIQTVVYNTQQKRALENLRNFKKQPYSIELIGDVETSYSEDVIINSELEERALSRHLKENRPEEDFWNYEYNYRSSIASAIHFRARELCGIEGAGKTEEELTEHERKVIETLEHRRWNAYMRAEGYVYSGSKDPSSRNDLAKQHHDLVSFDQLTEEERRKDGRVGTL